MLRDSNGFIAHTVLCTYRERKDGADRGVVEEYRQLRQYYGNGIVTYGHRMQGPNGPDPS